MITTPPSNFYFDNLTFSNTPHCSRLRNLKVSQPPSRALPSIARLHGPWEAVHGKLWFGQKKQTLRPMVTNTSIPLMRPPPSLPNNNVKKIRHDNKNLTKKLLLQTVKYYDLSKESRKMLLPRTIKDTNPYCLRGTGSSWIPTKTRWDGFFHNNLNLKKKHQDESLAAHTRWVSLRCAAQLSSETPFNSNDTITLIKLSLQ